MSFTKSISTCFRKYASFKGRATRSEYWWFWAFYVVLYSIPALLSAFFMAEYESELAGICSTITTIVALGLFLPLLAVQVRRNHDAGKSGWFVLVPVYNLILMFMPSEPNENKWGKANE